MNVKNRFKKKHFVYSEAFKRKVVSDIQEGLYSPWRAREIYKIGGKMTVYKWLERYDPSRVQTHKAVKMKNSNKENNADLKSRIRYLEQIVSDLTIEKKILETTIDVANETYGLDLKKNIVRTSLKEPMEQAKKELPSKD